MGHHIRNKYRNLSECLIQMRKYNFILLSDIVERVIIYCILSECLYRWEWVWLSLVDPARKWEHYFTTMKVQRAVRVLNDNYLFNIFGQNIQYRYVYMVKNIIARGETEHCTWLLPCSVQRTRLLASLIHQNAISIRPSNQRIQFRGQSSYLPVPCRIWDVTK